MIKNAACALTVGFGVVLSSLAQYPGHIESTKKAAPSVRAVAVLEWTGDTAKPTASRIIPISVFDGEQYQPGGLYLAKPQPLALESGTEYILQDAGVARGLFNVNSAQDMSGYWFGYGSWKPMAAPVKQAKPKQGKNMPEVVDSGNGRPHFKGSDSSAGPAPPATAPSPAPATDPDRPTLRKRSDSASAEPSSSGPDPAAPETAIAGGDPDRPHITRSRKPADEYQPAPLTGLPSGMQQMIAVSDSSEHEAHPFVYLWADPGDARKMQGQMELAASAAIEATQPVKTHAATTQRRKASTMPSVPRPLVFANEHFKAYELTYSGGATLVFSGEAANSAGKVKYVTLIAQPDFNGVPRVLFKSITDDDHLDQTPRMRLVDAVDSVANNRGDLVFELRSTHDREFVIYRIASGSAEQVFTTGLLANMLETMKP